MYLFTCTVEVRTRIFFSFYELLTDNKCERGCLLIDFRNDSFSEILQAHVRQKCTPSNCVLGQLKTLNVLK